MIAAWLTAGAAAAFEGSGSDSIVLVAVSSVVVTKLLVAVVRAVVVGIAAFVVIVLIVVVLIVVVIVVACGDGGGTGVIAGRGTDRVVLLGSEQTHSMFTQPQFNPSGRDWDAMHDWPFAIVMNDNSSDASNAVTKQNIFGCVSVVQ
jgi:hypothetical protein